MRLKYFLFLSRFPPAEHCVFVELANPLPDKLVHERTWRSVRRNVMRRNNTSESLSSMPLLPEIQVSYTLSSATVRLLACPRSIQLRFSRLKYSLQTIMQISNFLSSTQIVMTNDP